MENGFIDKEWFRSKLSELIFNQHQKIDSASTASPEIKARSEGYIEALYQVENVLINYQ